MLSFFDDQVIISNTDYNSQRAAYKLNQIITEYCLAISVQKTKLVTFEGRDPFKNKIVKIKL
jgi:hypothetical protein